MNHGAHLHRAVIPHKSSACLPTNKVVSGGVLLPSVPPETPGISRNSTIPAMNEIYKKEEIG